MSYGNVIAGSITPSSESDIPAKGGSIAFTAGMGSQVVTYTWASDGESAGSTTNQISPDATTKSISGSHLGTTQKARTSLGSVSFTWSGDDSKSASASSDIVYQEANAVTNSNYNRSITSYGTPSISIGSGMTAAGGSATVSHSQTNNVKYYWLYTSGSTAEKTGTQAGSTSIKITANGNSRFSLSGNTVSHSNMTTNATTDTVTITVTGEGSKTNSASVSITNARTLSSVYIVPYRPDSSWVVTVSNNNWNTCPASGGYVKCHGYANYTHTSGSSLNDQHITTDAALSWSTGYNSWITNHSNGGYYIANRGTTDGAARSSTAT